VRRRKLEEKKEQVAQPGQVQIEIDEQTAHRYDKIISWRKGY